MTGEARKSLLKSTQWLRVHQTPLHFPPLPWYAQCHVPSCQSCCLHSAGKDGAPGEDEPRLWCKHSAILYFCSTPFQHLGFQPLLSQSISGTNRGRLRHPKLRKRVVWEKIMLKYSRVIRHSHLTAPQVFQLFVTYFVLGSMAVNYAVSKDLLPKNKCKLTFPYWLQSGDWGEAQVAKPLLCKQENSSSDPHIFHIYSRCVLHLAYNCSLRVPRQNSKSNVASEARLTGEL